MEKRNKYVSPEYQAQLDRLAEMLVKPAVAEVIEIDVIEFPHGLRLCDPPELGWEQPGPEAA